MALLAGEILTAGRAQRLQPKPYNATASAPLTLTTTETDIPGCTIVLTTETAGATFKAYAAVDCLVTVVNATTIMEGRLTVDGVLQLGRSTHRMVAADRDTVAQPWMGTLATAGSHTFVLRGALTAASGTGAIQASNTKLLVEITEVV